MRSPCAVPWTCMWQRQHTPGSSTSPLVSRLSASLQRVVPPHLELLCLDISFIATKWSNATGWEASSLGGYLCHRMLETKQTEVCESTVSQWKQEVQGLRRAMNRGSALEVSQPTRVCSVLHERALFPWAEHALTPASAVVVALTASGHAVAARRSSTPHDA